MKSKNKERMNQMNEPHNTDVPSFCSTSCLNSVATYLLCILIAVQSVGAEDGKMVPRELKGLGTIYTWAGSNKVKGVTYAASPNNIGGIRWVVSDQATVEEGWIIFSGNVRYFFGNLCVVMESEAELKLMIAADGSIESKANGKSHTISSSRSDP